jgi:Fe-S-cluster containining protein
MSDLSNNIDNLKKKYRQIFIKTAKEFDLKFQKNNLKWILKFLNEDVIKEIYHLQKEILSTKEKFSCKGCAICCKFACSEFSYEELKIKAQNNDNLAKQFISIFIPYDNVEIPQKLYPEYFELLKKEKNLKEVYFYHCPKVTKYNLCSDYENRPQICRDFPDNPLAFLPNKCGYTGWKKKTEDFALKQRALFEIIEFYKNKLII